MKSAAKLGLLILPFLVLFSACESKSDNASTTTFEWAWASGANTVDQKGVYGTRGTAASSNVPGAREDGLSWLDSSGRLWLFGGYGFDSIGRRGRLNDLWRHDPTTKEWTWMSGGQAVNEAGSYGTRGVAAPSNVPGARTGAVSWTDLQGRLWLFGGLGYSDAGDYGNLHDLWMYDPESLRWTWVAGSKEIDQPGVYGTQGTAAPANVPGGRIGAVSWTDAQGLLWLFGGYGYDSAGTKSWLNDLWRYDLANLEWAWISGSNAGGQVGTYGTKGTADAANIPGARFSAVSWIDAQGLLWLFGGYGWDIDSGHVSLNDLWKYDPTTQQWTWVSGYGYGNGVATYGTLGTSATSNIPGAREDAASWLDSSGHLWLFGGYGYDSAGDKGWLNDLWEFDPDSSAWTWISGSDTGGQKGAYGTQGTASTSNVPGARYSAVSWMDSQGRLWLFGGYGSDSEGTGGRLNDLWRGSQ
jgi:N-acetylneuraminic acid mutarotase